MRADYRVLGPLEVLDGEPVALPAGRCHVLLATLLLRPNQFVPSDALVDRVWDGEPPSADRAHKTLQMAVSRLRGALGRRIACSGSVTVENEAELRQDLGNALAGLGRHEEVVVAWQRAIDLWRDLGDERAEELARRLAELGQEPGRRRGVDRGGAGPQRPPR